MLQAGIAADEAISLLQQYSWPGNVRELINCIERYVIISRQLGENDTDFVRNYIMSEQSEMMSVPPLSPPAALPVQSNVTNVDSDAGEALSGPEKNTGGIALSNDDIVVRLSTLEDMDEQIISAVIEKCDGSKQKAAQMLEVSRPTLLKKYNPERRINKLNSNGSIPSDSVVIKVSNLVEMENVLINETLERCRGSRKEAASDLGISRSTLWKRIQ